MNRVLLRRMGKSDVTLLVGSGGRIGLFTLPFLIVGLILNIAFPSVFTVGNVPTAVRVVSAAVFAVGVSVWAWSVVLIVTRVPRGELITGGPYAWVRHPLYTSVALLVLPSLGLLLNTWLGAIIGIVLYAGSRIYAPAEETALAKTFDAAWEQYRASVKIPWL